MRAAVGAAQPSAGRERALLSPPQRAYRRLAGRALALRSRRSGCARPRTLAVAAGPVQRVAIVGGGIAGLTLAHALK